MTWRRTLELLAGDRQGQTTLEYAMLLAAIVLPSMYLFLRLLATLRNMYAFVTLITSLPFP